VGLVDEHLSRKEAARRVGVSPGASHLDCEEIGQMELKGFDDPRQVCRVSLRE
jgi:hypothetical protein